MQFLCEYKKVDCDIDWNAKGRQLQSCLGHQIDQGWHLMCKVVSKWEESSDYFWTLAIKSGFTFTPVYKSVCSSDLEVTSRFCNIDCWRGYGLSFMKVM